MKTIKIEQLNHSHNEEYREDQYKEHMKEVAQETGTETEHLNLNENIINQIMEIVESSEEGRELEAYCRLKELGQIISESVSQIEPLAMQECDLHNSNSLGFEFKGFHVKRRNGGKTVEYNDVPQYVEKYKELQRYKEMLKVARMGVDSKTTMVQDNHMILADGEMLEIPKWKYSKDSIIVKKL